MTLKIDSDRAVISGLTNQDIATTVGTGLSGLSISQLRERDKLIGIALRLRPSERSQLDDLFSLNVANASSGVRVPLSQLASFRAPDHHAQNPQTRSRAVHDRPVRHGQRRAAQRSRQAALQSAASTIPPHRRRATGANLRFPPATAGSLAARSTSRKKGSIR